MYQENMVAAKVIENRYKEFHHGLRLAKEARSDQELFAVANALESTAERLIDGANPFTRGLAYSIYEQVDWVRVAQLVIEKVQKTTSNKE